MLLSSANDVFIFNRMITCADTPPQAGFRGIIEIDVIVLYYDISIRHTRSRSYLLWFSVKLSAAVVMIMANNTW